MSKKLTMPEVAALLGSVKDIVIVSHINPDGDALGSTIALAAGLRKFGKNVVISVDDDISTYYNFMPGIDQFVRFKPGDIIKTDLLVINDASSLDRIGVAAECVKAPILNIDHHVSNTEFADYLYLDVDAAATGEIVFQLFKELNIEIDLQMAFCLYVAIVTDCGYFKYSNTTPHCMNCAAELLAIGVEPDVVSDFLEMKSRDDIKLLSKVLETLSFACNGRVATIDISPEIYNPDIATDSYVHYPRYITGVEVALMFKGVEDNVTRVSMRSRRLDVSKIALSFGGGGHKRAAGCTIFKNITEAKKIILASILEEMGNCNG
ncbi:MAG: bifunctional oligoribonuclease/PAP phosphatase NrnA [Acidaminococcaceae bacterium]